MAEVVVRIKDLVTQFGPQVIHDHLDLEVYRGEIIGLVGGSGSGKTVLLNTILGLNRQVSGHIEVFGMDCCDFEAQTRLKRHWGVLFQSGALFSSMTVGENIEIPMREIAHIPHKLAQELIALRLNMVGLEPEVAYKYPEELSGGMVKRASLARALAIDAELLFLDEPTAGLDPIAAAAFDKLIKTLQSSLNLTVVMITHDLDSIYAVCDRIAVLVDKKVIVGTIDEIKDSPHPWIQAYFRGVRGRMVMRK